MMKVLQINAIYGEKSTGTIVKDINDMLMSNEIQSFVAYPGYATKHENEIPIGNYLDWKQHAIYTRLTGMQGLASLKATASFIQRLEKLKPDIIHLHNIHSNFLNYKMLLSYTSKNKIPLVITLHDCWFFTGKCYHFLDIGCDKWKTICNQCPKRKQDIPSILGDYSEKVFKIKKELYECNELYVVGCSNWITSCAKQSPLFREASFKQIYNGIDVDVFKMKVDERKNKLGLNGKFVILTMANKWFDEKNKEVRKKVENTLTENDRVLIIGCSEEQKKNNKNENIITIDYIKDKNHLASLYSLADVFVNLTLVDTLPTVNMEAACCGTPVITYDAGGSGELVEDGNTGYVIESLNAELLLDSIQKIKHGFIKRKDCETWARHRFNKNKNYIEYINLYKEIYTKNIQG